MFKKKIRSLKNKNLFDIVIYAIRVVFFFYNKFYIRNNHIKLNFEDVILTNKENVDTFYNNFFLDDSFDEIVMKADLICEHYFDLLGSSNVKVEYDNFGFRFESYSYKNQPNTYILTGIDSSYKPIDWHLDFKSGYRWDNSILYNEVRESSVNIPGVDIKVPWELSRFAHLSVLIKAYQITNNQKYINEIINQIYDWYLNNKKYRGVNWVCTMDVAIRIANISLAFQYINENFVVKKKLKELYDEILWDHFKYIIFNLEWTSKLTSNHYLSDISGLYVALLTSNKYKFVQKICIKILEKEITKQTNHEGVNTESSTSYHRLVTELFAIPALFCQKNKLNEVYILRLEKMFKFIKSITFNDGSIPYIGDNDSGIFVQMSLNQVSNFNYLNNLYKLIYKKELVINKKYTLYENTKLFVHKEKDLMLLFTNMNNGQNGNGGHAHNDKLSININYKGKNILVDPGTFVYTPLPDQRNRYRSTKYHNTVMINDLEQNRFIDDYLFGLEEDVTENELQILSSNDESIHVRGFHNGYSKISNECIHFRDIFIQKNKLEVFDKIDFDCNAKAYFTLDAESIIDINEQEIITKYVYIKFSENININKHINYCGVYGKKEKKLINIEVPFNYKLESTFTFI